MMQMIMMTIEKPRPGGKCVVCLHDCGLGTWSMTGAVNHLHCTSRKQWGVFSAVLAVCIRVID